MSAKVQTDQYFAALERLMKRGEIVSNDAVAVEAGKGRGSIKKSRPAHAALIAAINEAARVQHSLVATANPIADLRDEIADLTKRLDQSLEREVALLHELYDLRSKVNTLTEANHLLKLGRLVPVR